MSKTQSMVRAMVPAIAIAAAATCGSGATAASLTEGFDPGVSSWTGWTQKNNSTFIGDYPNWAQGCSVTCPFTAHEGTPAGSWTEAGSFISVDYQSTRNAGSGPETIDNWLIMPTMTFSGEHELTFYTRTEANSPYADSLEVRFGTGAAPMPGSSTGDVGSFDTLLLPINPLLVSGAYPETWSMQTVTIPSGVGAIAFRYYIENGGPAGANSNLVAIDTIKIAPIPEPATYLMMALGLGAIGLRRLRAMRG